mmetsp:Transcript_14386/g.28761  ORF Transcript_14386/g.28761 Transcript_14386/m.28761 type:complete len:449 (-) Transcript_14386:70-1416(-)
MITPTGSLLLVSAAPLMVAAFFPSFVPLHPSPSAFCRPFPCAPAPAGRRPFHPPRVSAAALDGDAPPEFAPDRILPAKILRAGLRGHRVASVYAVLGGSYKPGGGWAAHCAYVGLTRDLAASLEEHADDHGKKVKFVRAQSFPYPQRAAMEELAQGWLGEVVAAGGAGAERTVGEKWTAEGAAAAPPAATGVGAEAVVFVPPSTEEQRRDLELKMAVEGNLEFFLDDEDDEDDFDDIYDAAPSSIKDFILEEVAEAAPVAEERPAPESVAAPAASIVSPFDADAGANTAVTADEYDLEFTEANVDRVLDEVRPYLISDGGNVSVHRIDVEAKDVYLVLEGACGSCPSSTTTMKMGIERVLKEKFVGLGEVLQVEGGEVVQELSAEIVEAELGRMRQAITAMGGVVKLVEVTELGVVKLEFRGSTKIRFGVELAVRDIPMVKHVEFVGA